jgi:hypothetical protein
MIKEAILQAAKRENLNYECAGAVMNEIQMAAYLVTWSSSGGIVINTINGLIDGIPGGTDPPGIPDFDYIFEKYYDVVITKYKGTTANVTIPSQIYGKPVTGIRYSAFSGCASLESVTFAGTIPASGFSNDTFLSTPQ